MHCWAIIPAAGSGSRLAEAGLDRPKQFLSLEGVPLYWRSARVFARIAGAHGVVFVFPGHLLEEAERETAALAKAERFPLPFRVVAGGKERQDSVRNALAALPKECDSVLVHDAARPFLSATLAASVLQALEDGHDAVVPGVPVVDTVKKIDEAGFVAETPDRNRVRAVQTPQGFSRAKLTAAHEEALSRSLSATDDAALMEACGLPVFVVPGDPANIKITTPEDLARLAAHAGTKASGAAPAHRTGFGYDVHACGGERPFILGGVPIPTDIGVFAHSDGDVLLHALIDAILGCLGRGDIGTLFPDTDPAFDGVESGVLLAETLRLAAKDGFSLSHADMTIVAQAPKIAPHRANIAANVAKLLGLPRNAVNVKATTEEKLGFTGEKKGVKAYAVVSGTMRQQPENA